MSIITISRTHGSKGRIIGQKAAEALGYTYMNKHLLVEVAREAQVSVSEVEKYDEKPDHPALRALKQMLMGPPQDWSGMEGYTGVAVPPAPRLSGVHSDDFFLLEEDDYARMTRNVIERLADSGRVVLIGRGAAHILADRPDALHIRIVAPWAFRVQTLRAGDDLSNEDAKHKIDEVDSLWSRYVKRHYHVDWDNSEF